MQPAYIPLTVCLEVKQLYVDQLPLLSFSKTKI